MTRQRKYYLPTIGMSREATTRVMTNGRLGDALSNGEPGPGAQRGTLTVPQVAALTALVLAHLFDYTSFLILISRHGLSAEANPIVVRIFQITGIPGLTIAKLATVTFAAVLMLVILPHRPKLAMALVVFGVAAGVFGGLSNVASF